MIKGLKNGLRRFWMISPVIWNIRSDNQKVSSYCAASRLIGAKLSKLFRAAAKP
jgi:hypothetical protein